MEVETTTTPPSKHIKIHPLAIITISDHHTRITSGGSALPPTSPTIGLLFGQRSNDTISIVDAEELDPTSTPDSNQLVQTKIELHRKVFPLHHVVGWYRVALNDEGPTSSDLSRNQLEISQYCSASSPVFLLLNAGEEMNAPVDLVRDDQLPISVYETLEGEECVFVNAEFELETFEPERIALEKVFRDAPKGRVVEPPAAAAATKSGEEARKVKKSKKEEPKQSSEVAVQRSPSELDGQLESLQGSIRAMNARMGVLLEYLQKVEKGEVPRDEVLLRSIEGLLTQLPAVYAALEEGVASFQPSGDSKGRMPLRELDNEYNDTMLLSYLACVAKTARSVHIYTEKYRGACEVRR